MRLIVTGLLHFRPYGVRVETPVITSDLAMPLAEAVILNEAPDAIEFSLYNTILDPQGEHEMCIRDSCCCTLRRRAFLILFLRRRDRFEGGVEEFAAVCPLAAAVLRLAGVHFSSCFSSGLGVSTVMAGILPPCARGPLLFFASPSCILNVVSPPA